MYDDAYTVRWLTSDDADELAILEASVHPEEHRAGADLIRAQLRATESDGCNLSLALVHKDKLVGYWLAFLMRSRTEMAEFFDAPVPAGLDSDAAVTYISDWGVERPHRRAAGMLAARFVAALEGREDLRGLPVDAFSTSEYAEKWTGSKGFVARLGHRLVARFPYRDERLKRTMHWLSFEPVPRQPLHPRNVAETLSGASVVQIAGTEYQVGLIQDATSWLALRLQWNELLARTGTASVLESWEYLSSWYGHFAVLHPPRAVAALREGNLLAVLPLVLAPNPSWGRERPYLMLAGQNLADPPSGALAENPAALQAIEIYITRRLADWEGIELRMRGNQRDLLTDIKWRLRRSGSPACARPDTPRPSIDLRGDWQALVRSRRQALRDSVAAGESALSQHGTLRFDFLPCADDASAIERYFEIEQSAPDDEAGYGACASSQHIAFYRTLSVKYARSVGLHVGLLHCGDVAVAGMIGFLWRRRFHLVHLTRTSAVASAGARLVALGRLTERCSATNICDIIELSGLADQRAMGWADRREAAATLRAHRATAVGWLLHGASAISRTSRET